MQTHYFIDFDNTISNQDVWDTIVQLFAPDEWKEHVSAYVRGDITSRECNLRLARIIPPREAEAREAVLAIGIDPTFHDFVHWAQDQETPVTIVSDGYDYYIRLLLEAEGLGHLLYYSNCAVWTDTGITVEFPFHQKDCERDMAHCKCQHIRDLSGIRRVYIGDGVSDLCAAVKCDHVYAKHMLLKYCRENKIACTPFENFQQIIEHEDKIFNRVQEWA